jgi:tetratricopeptide (TPR) repeat protein
MFRISIQNEQLKDSTLRDNTIYNIFKAKELQIKGDHTSALNILHKVLWHSDSLKNFQHQDILLYMIYESLYQTEQYSDAIQAIEAATILQPTNKLYLKNYALMLQGFQQYEEAITQFKKLNKLEPYNTDNIYTLCNLYLQTKQYKKSHKELDKYEKLEGESLETIAIRASIFKAANKSNKIEPHILTYIDKHPEDHYSASLVLNNVYVSENKNQKSYSLLNSLNKKYPNDATILLALAEYYKNANNDTLSEQYTLDAIKTTDLTDSYTIKLIRPLLSGYIQENNNTKLTQVITQLNTIYPNNIKILELEADIYKAQQDTTRWKQTLYQIRELKNDENIDLQLIQIYDNLNNKAELLKLTKEGYQKFNKDNWAFLYIISLFQNELTDTLISESFKILPSVTTPHFKSTIYQIIGDTYSILNNDSLSMQMYDSCLIYDPNNAIVLNNVAYNITKQPNPDLKKAEKMAAKALELESENTYILDTYAWILFLQGDNFLSEFYFNKLLRIENANNANLSIETLYHIGCLYFKTNRIDQAKEMWQQALEIYNLNPDNFNEKNIIETIINFFQNNEK